MFRPAFVELGVRDEDEGVRFAVEGVFDRFVVGRLVFDGLVLGRLVDPERAGLERFVLPLDRDAPPRDPPRR
ncbi:hypothetical protein ACFL5T_00355 [Gemmatimonadota bacterium]